MHRGRQNRDAAGDFTEPKVLDQDLTELAQGELLVLAIHRRAGVDHVAQGTVVVAIHGGVLNQHLDDRRYGEQVADLVLLDQLPEGFGFELVFRRQHGSRAACHVEQRVDARPV